MFFTLYGEVKLMECKFDEGAVRGNRNTVKLKEVLVTKSVGAPRVGIYVDYPNLVGGAISHYSYANFKFLRQISNCLGLVTIANCYAINSGSEKNKSAFLELERMGFEIILRETPGNESGINKDIDTLLITDFMKDLYNSNLDIMIIVSDDSDFAPALREAKRVGKKCISIVSEYSRARIIAETSDIYLEEPYRYKKPKLNKGAIEEVTNKISN